MAPKDKVKVKLCPRCPDAGDAMGCRAAQNKKQVAKCDKKYDCPTPKLWRGFNDTPDAVTTSLDGDKEACQNLISQAYQIDHDARIAAEKQFPDQSDAIENHVNQAKANENFAPGIPLTKQHLEFAFQTLYPGPNGPPQPVAASNENTNAAPQQNESINDTEATTQDLVDAAKKLSLKSGDDSVGSQQPESSGTSGQVAVDKPFDGTDLPLVLCNRCPTREEALNHPSHAGNLVECMKMYSKSSHDASELWWDYPVDLKNQDPVDMVPDLAFACELNQTVKVDNKSYILEARKNNPGNLAEQLKEIRLRRFQAKLTEDDRLTKQILEHAAQYEHGARVVEAEQAEQAEQDEQDDTVQTNATTDAQAPTQGQSPQEPMTGDLTSWGSSCLVVDGQASIRAPLQIEKPASTTKTGYRRDKATASTGNKVSGKIVTNHFELKVKPKQKLYEYQVIGLNDQNLKLSAPRKKVLLKRLVKISKALKGNEDSFAYNKEGQLIAWKALTTSPVQKNQAIELFKINDFSRDHKNGEAVRQIPLDLVFKREIDLDDFVKHAERQNEAYEETGTAQALDILISHGVTKYSGGDGAGEVFQIGNNKFFPSPDKSNEMLDFDKWELIAMRGFSSNVKAGNKKLLLNVNTAFSAFYKPQKVSKYLEYFARHNKAVPGDKDAAKHLRGLRVKILYDRFKPGADQYIDTLERRTKTITGFSKTSAENTYFFIELPNGKKEKKSVWEFFSKEYPNAAHGSDRKQICINTGGKEEGTECWYLPDQLEVLPGQLYDKTLESLDAKMDDGGKSMTEKMLDFACNVPDTNKEAIEREGLSALQIGKSMPPVLQRAGIQIACKMMDVQFRPIPRPQVMYDGGKKEAKYDAPSSWTSKNMKLHSTAHQIKQGVDFIHAGDVAPDLRTKCEDSFKDILPRNGINVGGPINWHGVGTSREAIDAAVRASSADLVALVPKGPATRPFYADFRSVVDQTHGKPSIVLNGDRMKGIKGLGAYMGSNVLKINLRLGNENHTLKGGFDKLKANNQFSTLVLGADLIHPKQSSAECTPSIAALVGSVDENCATFLGSARYQPSGQEYIEKDKLMSMTKERVKAWQAKMYKTQKYPARILYYRDGTGHTQFKDIEKVEIAAIREGWAAATGNKPGELIITTIMVIKRHNTRFFPVHSEYKTTTGNCTPGIVVDRDITSPYYVDFFLQSHDVEKGSAKPTHYFVLSNGMNLTEASLQNITNNFCYIYAHSTQAVSYPAPAYYADKLCERAMLYLQPFFDGAAYIKDKDLTTQTKLMQEAWDRGGQEGGNPWHQNLNNKMFWM